jgi:serine/threonine protein phosphatase PrpC
MPVPEVRAVTVRVTCSHCGTPCLVAEAHLGKPVRCGQCRRVFTPPPPAPESDDCLPTFDEALPAVPLRLTTPRPRPRLDVGAATSVGRVRERNEDSFLVQHLTWSNLDERHEAALLVVADGMGGYDAGDRASDLVIRTLNASVAPLLAGAMNSKLTDAAGGALMSALTDGLRDANRVVFQKGQTDRTCKGMGATGAVALVWDDTAFIAHVGDARVYHHSGGRVKQVTKDQTLVTRMVEMGTLSPQEALTHPKRNEVTQAIGKQADLSPGEYRVSLSRGDWLLVACDGLHAHVEGNELETRIARAPAAAAVFAEQLVEEVNRRGGSDNVTVVVVRCY